MKQMVVVIELGRDDTTLDIDVLSSEVIEEINDRGYAVTAISVDGEEVFENTGFNRNFFNRN